MLARRGFTLIEILVVIVIIGISLTMAMLSFGDFGAGRRAVMAAEHFASYVKLVQQRAIFQVNTLGINIDKNGYETFRYIPGKNWTTLTGSSLFRRQSFPALVEVTRTMAIYNRNKRPDIIISPSGDMSPFVLTFGTPSEPSLAKLTGQQNGEIILKLIEN